MAGRPERNGINMKMNSNSIARMKKLVEDAKKANTITPSEKAFAQYPPEGTWEKNENEEVMVKEA